MKPTTIARVAARAIEVRLRSALGRRLRPYKALLELTSECNSRCTTCDIWKTPAPIRKADIGLPEIERLFEGFGPDLVWLALSGGEVTLVDHFPEVIAAAKRLCPKLSLVTFTTNGLLPEKAVECAGHISRAGFDLFVTVSLDGDEETHDRIRGVAGNHALALRSLQLLRAAGVPSHFGITLGDDNQKFVREHFEDHQADIKAVTFVESGGMYRRKNSVDDAGVVESLARILREYRIKGPGEFVEWIYLRLALRFFKARRQKLPLPCDVLRTSVHVRPNGDVAPCMFLPALGNLRRDSFPALRDSARARESLRQIDSEKCPRCWMNCYAPHSILSRPVRALVSAVMPSR